MRYAVNLQRIIGSYLMPGTLGDIVATHDPRSYIYACLITSLTTFPLQ